MPIIEPHHARDVAESFGADVERYDRARPSYPPALIEWIVAAAPGRRFLDVGAGTSIATRLFRAAGCEVLGLDADPRMPAADEVSRFEDWDPAGRVFDAVIAAQTWHWIDPVAGGAKAAEVLAPGGVLALFWNVPRPDPELGRALASAYENVTLPFEPWTGDPLAAYDAMVAKAMSGLTDFAPPSHERFEWSRTYTREQWLDQVPTFGGHSRLPAGELAAVLRRTAAALDDEFTMPYTTVALSTTCRARTRRTRSARSGR